MVNSTLVAQSLPPLTCHVATSKALPIRVFNVNPLTSNLSGKTSIPTIWGVSGAISLTVATSNTGGEAENCAGLPEGPWSAGDCPRANFAACDIGNASIANASGNIPGGRSLRHQFLAQTRLLVMSNYPTLRRRRFSDIETRNQFGDGRAAWSTTRIVTGPVERVSFSPISFTAGSMRPGSSRSSSLTNALDRKS